MDSTVPIDLPALALNEQVEANGFNPLEPYATPAVPHIPHTWIPVQDLVLQPNVRLGSGSFGTVYQAQWRGVAVACKEIDTARQAIDDTESEMQILSILRHPNVVPFYGICRDGGRVYIVMEHCAEGSLRSSTVTGLARRIQLLMDIAAGLDYLHVNHIVHGDVKPDNVLINDNRAKVSDFGGSAMTNLGQSVTAQTLRWSAPEVVVGAAVPSSASDVWSFGLVVLELITGQPPYPTLRDNVAIVTTLREALQRRSFTVLDVDGHDISNYSGVSHRVLVNIVGRCCLFDRRQRPTMREVHTMLNTALIDATRNEPQLAAQVLLSTQPVIPATNSTGRRSMDVEVIRTALQGEYTQRLRNLKNSRPNHPWLYCSLQAVIVPQPLQGDAQRPIVTQPGRSVATAHAWLDSHQVLAFQKRSIPLNALFEPLSGEDTAPRVVSVIGPAGIGKTTFSWQVTLDDTDDGGRRAPLWPQFVWKIHITLRDVAMTQRERSASPDTRVIDLLYHYVFKDLSVFRSVDDVEEIIQQWTPDNCLLILDGLDEVDINGSHRGLQCLLDFARATRLITARPHRVQRVDQCGRVVELCGFSSEQVWLYVGVAVAAGSGQLIELIKRRPYLSLHSRTPLQLRIICELWSRNRQSVESLSTVTSLYDTMSRHLLVRDMTDREREQRGVQLSKAEKESVLVHVEAQLCETAWMMFFGRDNGQTVEQWLLEEQYQEAMRPRTWGGNPIILTAISANNPLFVERIIEEFFNEIGRCYSFAHYSFQEYYCARRLVSLLMSDDPTAEDVIRRFRSDDRYSLVFQFAVGTLGQRRDSGDVMRRVFELFVRDERNIRRIGYLCALLDAGKCSHVTDSPPFRSVVELLVTACGGSELRLSDVGLSSTVVAVLSAALCYAANVHELVLTNCHLELQAMVELAKMLHVNTSLTSLGFGGNNFTSHDAAALADVLRGHGVVRLLTMSHNEIGIEGACALAASLQVNTVLRELVLKNCTVEDEGATALADMLRVNTTLTSVVLEDNNIKFRGAVALASVPSVNSTLKTLEVREIGSHLVFDGSLHVKSTDVDVLLSNFAVTTRTSSRPLAGTQ